MPTVQVLLSCMHQKDFSIVQRSRLENIPTLVINQTDVAVTKKQNFPLLCWIDTPGRGLSVSRNLAIANATADIGVLADDDEIFEADLVQRITAAYEKYPQADIIIFKLSNRVKALGNKPRRLGKYDLLRVASWQITFRLKSVRGKFAFDTKLGAGTGNGGGEENKFLLDCYKQGLKIQYVPCVIAAGIEQPSTWFFGYDAAYFYTRGKSTRYIYGFWFACIYGVYFLIKKHPKYGKEISCWHAGKALWRGIRHGL